MRFGLAAEKGCGDTDEGGVEEVDATGTVSNEEGTEVDERRERLLNRRVNYAALPPSQLDLLATIRCIGLALLWEVGHRDKVCAKQTKCEDSGLEMK